jgi:predicted metal-binding protein
VLIYGNQGCGVVQKGEPSKKEMRKKERKVTKAGMKQIEKLARAHNLKDFKWMDPRTTIPRQWVRNKCIFGCRRYGQKACCPPEVPSVAECKGFFAEYRYGLFYHLTKQFADPKDLFPWAREVNKQVLAFERDVFLSGFHKAFAFTAAPCNLCELCQSTKRECRNPLVARPALEAFGVDVYGTARKMGYSIQVIKGYEEETNRFGLLLVE